jgi:hypothetical protein
MPGNSILDEGGHSASAGELKNNGYDKEDRFLYRMRRICRARERLRCRSRRKRRRVVVGSRGSRHVRGVVATAASQAIMRVPVR